MQVKNSKQQTVQEVLHSLLECRESSFEILPASNDSIPKTVPSTLETQGNCCSQGFRARFVKSYYIPFPQKQEEEQEMAKSSCSIYDLRTFTH